MAAVGLSCAKYVGPNEKYTVQDILSTSDNYSGTSSQLIVPSDTVVFYRGGITVTPLFGPEDKNWISPGKVFVRGIYPGGKAEYLVTIHNGKEKDSIFSVVARSVDKFDVGYKNFPLSWVYISNISPLIRAGETITVPIYIEIPLDYRTSYQEKMEFLVGVIDEGRGGNVIIELCSKWLVTTK